MTEHLIKQLFLQQTFTRNGYDNAPEELINDLTNNLVKQLFSEAEKHKLLMRNTEVKKIETIEWTEEGPEEVVIFTATGYAYRPDESAEHSVIKIGIDEALAHWVDTPDD